MTRTWRPSSRDIPRRVAPGSASGPRLPVRFRSNTASAYGVTILGVALAAAITPVLTGSLSVKAYGVWALAGSSVMYLELFQLGFSAGATKVIAESIGDDAAVSRAVSTAVWALRRPAAAALGLGLALAAAFPLVFRTGTFGSEARLVVAMLAVNVAMSIPAAAFAGVLQAHQRHARLNAVLGVVAAAQWTGWALVVHRGGGLVGLGVVAVVVNLAGQAAVVVLALRLMPAGAVRRSSVQPGLASGFRMISLWLALTELASVVIERIDLLLVGVLVGVPEAGVYAVGVKLASMGGRLVGPAAVTVLPFASQLAAERGRPAVRDAWLASTRLVLAVAMPVSLTLVLLARPAVSVWVGPRYRGAAIVVVCLAAAGLLGALKLPGARVLAGMGLARPVALITTVEAAMNLVLDAVLAPHLGLAGVAVASLIASTAVNLGLFVPYACRALDSTLRSYIGPLARAHAPSVATTLAVWLAVRSLAWHGRPGLLAAGAALAGGYMAVFAATGLEPAERRALLAWRPRRVSLPDPESDPEI